MSTAKNILAPGGLKSVIRTGISSKLAQSLDFGTFDLLRVHYFQLCEIHCFLVLSNKGFTFRLSYQPEHRKKGRLQVNMVEHTKQKQDTIQIFL